MASKNDQKLFSLIVQEEKRQKDGLEMIPSENYVSPAVRKALGSVLTNKYSEGYPGRRYYAGNEIVDQIERLAIERAKKVFRLPNDWQVNVQPYSGSPANQAVYLALVDLGDKVMGMHLAHGGHLSHGWPVSFSGKNYQAVQYGVDRKTRLLDYKKIWQLAKKEKPKLIWAGATAYPRVINWQKFAEIAHDVGAYFAADIAHYAGLIVAGIYPSPIGVADVVTTTTHKTLRGPRGAMIFCRGDLATKINRAVFPGLQGGPHDHQTAAIAACLAEATRDEFKRYGKQVVKNAQVLAKELLSFSFDLVTGGTENHLILLDLRNKKIGGQKAQEVLEVAGITVNKNTIPFDLAPPANPSGIRLGTPALTTRGMKEKEMKMIASWFNEVIAHPDDKQLLKRIKQEVRKLCQKFPLP
jgi:glycine hydroxymethyltransferase